MDKNVNTDAIYDARALGVPKMVTLGFQHMFAMFGATVLVPALTGLNVATTLLFAGLGTLLFHFLAKGKVPAFLGSSFAFLPGYFAIAPDGDPALLPYACFAVACAGLMYVILAAFFKAFGTKRVMRYFPPIVTGPIIIAIGLSLSSSAIQNCQANWWIALVAIAVVIIANIWGKGMIKIIPILLGVVASYVAAMIFDPAARAALAENVSSAAWIGIPIHKEATVFGLFSSGVDKGMLVTALITIIPLSLTTMVEHIGDISAISSTCGRNFMEDPGFHRTLLGDGLATTLASLFGAPANTTYGENTGVLALSKVYDPKVIRLAACYAIVLSFIPKMAQVIGTMPSAIIGGISFILYGMISAIGIRNMVENQVDFTKSRNLIIAAVIMVCGLGLGDGATFTIGSVTITLTSLAIASIVGIVLNAVLPGNDYEFGVNPHGDENRGIHV